MESSDNDTLLVLRIAKRCEAILRDQYLATGNGLHELLTSVESTLSQDESWAIRVVASIRNKIAHEDGFETLDSYTKQKFERACARLRSFLDESSGDDAKRGCDDANLGEAEERHEGKSTSSNDEAVNSQRVYIDQRSVDLSKSVHIHNYDVTPNVPRSSHPGPWHQVTKSIRIRHATPETKRFEITPDRKIRFKTDLFELPLLLFIAAIIIIFVVSLFPDILGLLIIGLLVIGFLSKDGKKL